jgi:hypothetical protein
MRNSTLRTSGRPGFVPSNQLCNRLLHNWFLNTHPYIGTLLTQGMKPTGVLL